MTVQPMSDTSPIDAAAERPGADAEAAVAGGVMWLDAGAALDLGRNLQPADLQTPAYALILRLALELAAAGIPPEPVLVVDRARGELSPYQAHKLGVAVAALYSAAPVPPSLPHYVAAVIRNVVRREAAACGLRLQQAASGSLEQLAQVWADVAQARSEAAQRLAGGPAAS